MPATCLKCAWNGPHRKRNAFKRIGEKTFKVSNYFFKRIIVPRQTLHSEWIFWLPPLINIGAVGKSKIFPNFVMQIVAAVLGYSKIWEHHWNRHQILRLKSAIKLLQLSSKNFIFFTIFPYTKISYGAYNYMKKDQKRAEIAYRISNFS